MNDEKSSPGVEKRNFFFTSILNFENDRSWSDFTQPWLLFSIYIVCGCSKAKKKIPSVIVIGVKFGGVTRENPEFKTR